MAVLLTISETLSGPNVSDALAGGGTGLDLGQVTNGSYAPIEDQENNLGAQILYVRHDAIVDPITEVKIYLDSYAQTGFTYGGPSNTDAAENLASILQEGLNTDITSAARNNANGLASGLWMDMDYDVNTTNQFDIAGARGGEAATKYVKVFGRLGQGQSAATAFDLIKEACLFTPDNSAENAPSAPVDGKIGISTDAALGNRAKIRLRIYLKQAFADGGIFQLAKIFRYSYTA
jgi:hypothetical protein